MDPDATSQPNAEHELVQAQDTHAQALARMDRARREQEATDAAGYDQPDEDPAPAPDEAAQASRLWPTQDGALVTGLGDGAVADEAISRAPTTGHRAVRKNHNPRMPTRRTRRPRPRAPSPAARRGYAYRVRTRAGTVEAEPWRIAPRRSHSTRCSVQPTTRQPRRERAAAHRPAERPTLHRSRVSGPMPWWPRGRPAGPRGSRLRPPSTSRAGTVPERSRAEIASRRVAAPPDHSTLPRFRPAGTPCRTMPLNTAPVVVLAHDQSLTVSTASALVRVPRRSSVHPRPVLDVEGQDDQAVVIDVHHDAPVPYPVAPQPDQRTGQSLPA